MTVSGQGPYQQWGGQELQAAAAAATLTEHRLFKDNA
jgi:hypothetical protein